MHILRQVEDHTGTPPILDTAASFASDGVSMKPSGTPKRTDVSTSDPTSESESDQSSSSLIVVSSERGSRERGEIREEDERLSGRAEDNLEGERDLTGHAANLSQQHRVASGKR